MQKLNLIQGLGQKLSPQQIQFINLLQVNTAELETRVKEELEDNPVLEEGIDEPNINEDTLEEEDDELNVEDYLNDDDVTGYKMQGDGNYAEEKDSMPISDTSSLHDQLITQLNFLDLDAHQHNIGLQLIGSIENDGYVRRGLDAIMNDLAFSQNIETTEAELEAILKMIQKFDPAGIGARDLRECLLIQLEKREEAGKQNHLACELISDNFEAFSKKHYETIMNDLEIDESQLKETIQVITKLNPKPGGGVDGLVKTQYLIADFILTKNINGDFDLVLNQKNAPDLRISQSYADLFDSYAKSNKKDKKLKETVSFVKKKMDAAKWFIDALVQRQYTLLNTMHSILRFQHAFFQDGDESKLRPMILKDVADDIEMDVSTVSRVANSKSIQTEFGMFPLKFFFTEGIATDSGEDVSSREVKQKLKEIIDNEDKSKPLSDDKLEKLLRSEGYQIARRTLAKYREQMNLPVARLRKEL